MPGTVLVTRYISMEKHPQIPVYGSYSLDKKYYKQAKTFQKKLDTSSKRPKRLLEAQGAFPWIL